MKTEHVTTARKLLGWTQSELAERAGIDRRTVSNIECAKHAPSSHTLRVLRKAFESAGVEFVDEGCPSIAARNPSLGVKVDDTFD